MPHYDYQCKTCGQTFEVFQSMTEDKLTDCPLDDCAGQVKRLLGTGAGIIFKGSGFYETDFKDKKQPAKKESPKKESTESAKSDSTSTSSDNSK